MTGEIHTARTERAIAFLPEAAGLDTPAFVYDETTLLHDVGLARAAIEDKHSKLLFALKSFSCVHGLTKLAGQVDGFHASSLFEARLARQILGPSGMVHVTTPGLRHDEFDEICRLSNMVSFNTLAQWERFKDRAGGHVKCGLRVNPRLSLVPDERYDPCRRHSKLGAPLGAVRELMIHNRSHFDGISGLLVHTNCDSTDLRDLHKTARHLDEQLAPLLSHIQWINLGGGYLFHDPAKLGPLHDTIALFRSKYDLEVLFEPGASIIRRAGSLVSSVVDLFESDGKTVAVLDASVNHLPEAFEFQFAPDVAGDLEEGAHEYILAGASCLAGDLFGEYAFNEPLGIGSRVTFLNVGAYSMVKANRFNGINLPSIYGRDRDGRYDVKKRFSYDEFFLHCGGELNADL